MLDPITMACGIATSAVAMCICLRDWLGPLVGRRQPVEKLLVEWERPVISCGALQTTQRTAYGFGITGQDIDTGHLRPAWQVILEREQTQRMREAGLKCSVINGRVVRDREI